MTPEQNALVSGCVALITAAACHACAAGAPAAPAEPNAPGSGWPLGGERLVWAVWTFFEPRGVWAAQALCFVFAIPLTANHLRGPLYEGGRSGGAQIGL